MCYGERGVWTLATEDKAPFGSYSPPRANATTSTSTATSTSTTPFTTPFLRDGIHAATGEAVAGLRPEVSAPASLTDCLSC